MKIPFIGASYEARSKVINCQECVNLYPEVNPAGSKSVAALIGTPGLTAFVNLGGDPIRGMYTTASGRLFVAQKLHVYELFADGTKKIAATLTSIFGAVHFADNGVELLIVDGVSGYVFGLDSYKSEEITDALFVETKATQCLFLDGYFVVNQPASGRFYYSDLYDGKTWLGYYTAETSADVALSIGKKNGELWIMGTQSAEVWYGTGNSADPFSRIHGGFSDIGIMAANSVAYTTNTIFWLGSSKQGVGVVWMATGYQPQRISTHGIEYPISQMATTTDAIAYCYQQEGHSFYVLSFPGGDRTFVYDITTGLWHERASWNIWSGKNQMWQAVHCAFFNNQHYVGSSKDGNVYLLDFSNYTENTIPIRRVRTAQHLSGENKRFSYNLFELEMERGIGLPDAQITASGSVIGEIPGYMPLVMLSWSDDGGFTWSSEHHWSAGKLGEFKTRVKWHRLGQARDRVFRVAISDPVKVVLCDAYAQIEPEVE